jgi:hypothetical protein
MRRFSPGSMERKEHYDTGASQSAELKPSADRGKPLRG